MRGIWFFFALGAFTEIARSAGSTENATPERHLNYPIRGVWVANVGRRVLDSKQDSQKFVDECSRLGFNTLCVVVWNRGQTLYPGEVMERDFGVPLDPPFAVRDPLRDLIEAAHSKDIRVLAWFEFGFSCSYGNPDGGLIIRTNPHWAARDADGKLTSKNGFQWMNAFHPEVQDFMLDLMKEVVSNYEVDGVQGDDRLPACPSTAGYDDWTVAHYAREHNGARPRPRSISTKRGSRGARICSITLPSGCIANSSSLTITSSRQPPQAFFRGADRNTCKIGRPGLPTVGSISSAPSSTAVTCKATATNLKSPPPQVPEEKRNRVFPGILVRTADGYRTSDDHLRQMIAANREVGFDGEITFYDSALQQHSKVYAELYGTK